MNNFTMSLFDLILNAADALKESMTETLRKYRAEMAKVTEDAKVFKAEEEYIGNLVVPASDNRYSYFETAYNGRSFSGTGDLFASVVIGALVKGQSAEAAVQLAMKFLQPAIEDAMREKVPRDHGVCFEKYLKFLLVEK